MDRNIEIKATLHNKQDIISQLKTITNTEGEVIIQHDTFYKVPDGRLKMRIFPDKSSVLIHYHRPNIAGPKLSKYIKYHIEGPDQDTQTDVLQSVLLNSLGVLGEVKKTRLLFMIGQTRVHVDTVERLGDFIELEVVLNETQSTDDGQDIANEIMNKLGISEKDLLTHAYIDMLQN